jgi:hypothetical protein
MKKISSFFLLIFFNISLFSSQTISQCIGLRSQNIQCDGFAIDTLIITPQGLIKIQDLQRNDIVLGINNELSIVIHISCQKVSEYLEIKTDQDVIYAGIKQKFYLTCLDNWITAGELKIGDQILSLSNTNSVVRDIRCVQQEAFLYQLTTNNHLLTVSQSQLLAHNADLVLSPIAIGCISVINPVTATIGVTLALSAGALLVYQKMHKKRALESIEKVEINLDECERLYYEERRNELLNLKKELVAVQNGLLLLDPSSKKSFTNIFLPYIKCDIKIKNNFFTRNQRELHLRTLEEETIELQTQICFHFAELMKRVEHACEKYDAHCARENIFAYDWNSNLKNIPINTAYILFEKIVQALELLSIIENRLAELEIVCGYYKQLKKGSILKKSTNIDLALIYISKITDKSKKNVNKSKSLQENNKKIVIDFLQSKYAPVDAIEKNVLTLCTVQTQQEESQELERAHTTYKQIPRHSVAISQTSTALPCPCNCGCKRFECGCTCGCPCKKERKVNQVTKQEFFNCPIIRANYEHYRNGIYKLKTRGNPIVKNAEYLQWDHLHNDVEVYSDSETHLGSLDPKTMNLYKPPVRNRPFPGK